MLHQGRCVASAAVLLLISAVNLLAQGEATAPPTWQTPESFSRQGRAADFIPYARQLLQQQSPGDDQAARLALDLWMTSMALGDQDSAQLAKAYLLIEQGESLPATFLLRVISADEQRKVLTQRFQDVDQPFAREERHRFSRACERYVQQFGPPSDDLFWAQAALCTDNPSVAAERQKHIKDDDGDAAKLLDIALDDTLSPREQFLKLQTLPDAKSAHAYQQYLYARVLTEEDRATPDVEAAQIERLIKTHRYADAIPRLSKLYVTTKDPKFAVWLAWSQTSAGQASAALETLDPLLAAKADDSAWRKVGRELRDVIGSLEENQLTQRRVIDGVVQELGRAPIDRLELCLNFQDKELTPWRAYLQLDLVTEGVEVHIARRDELLVAYQASLDAARLYLTGEPQIQAFKTGGMVPMFAASIAPKAPGGFNGRWNFNTTKPGSGQLRSSVRAILSSPDLIVPARRHALLNHALTSGLLPARGESDAKGTIVRWVSLRLDAPQLDTYSLTVSPERRITSIELNKHWTISDLRYGQRQMAFATPEWPELPVAESPEFSASNFMMLFSKLMAMWEKKNPAVANKP